LFEDFAREVGKDNIEVFPLVPAGADPHTYSLSAADLARLKDADFVFLNGGGLDTAMQDAIEASLSENAHVIPFTPNIRSPQGGGLTAEQAGDNPHLWLDPALASVYAEIIADELSIYDGVHQQYYSDNLAAYKQRLNALASGINTRLQAVPAGRRRLVTLHDSFPHLARRFDLKVSGFLVETSADAVAEANVTRLAAVIAEQEVPAVFTEYGFDAGAPGNLAAQTGVPLCTLVSDISPPDATTYEQVMTRNSDELVRCLGG